MRHAPARWGARAATLLVAIGLALALVPAGASAHPLSTTAVLLDVGPDRVTGQVQLPIDRLAIALDQPLMNAATVAQPAELADLERYITGHLSGTDADSGTPWAAAVTGGRVGVVDGVDHLIVDVALTPPTGAAGDLRLRYDGIVERLLSHRILVSSRPAGTDDAYTALGVLDWQSQTVTVPAERPSFLAGFVAAVGLGIGHIAEGADHLLFLLMLLLPAPLIARRGRWARSDDLRGQMRRTVAVVTAFAVGHSLTLVLAALGYLSAPTGLVESLIAASILVSGVHAIRPIVRGGEVGIAGVFGLMHGLAFATLLGALQLGRTSLVAELLGFNLGIELTQLIVLALVMPSLIILARTRAYTAVRLGLAGVGVVLAAGWLAERTGLIAHSPVDAVAEWLVDYPFALPVVLTAAAGGTLLQRGRRRGRIFSTGSVSVTMTPD